MKPSTDWMTWVLHGGLGLIIGACFALRFFSSFLFIIALSLIGLGAGSLLGDRLWSGSFVHTLPPDEPAHGRFSRILSISMICAGCALALLAAYLQL